MEPLKLLKSKRSSRRRGYTRRGKHKLAVELELSDKDLDLIKNYARAGFPRARNGKFRLGAAASRILELGILYLFERYTYGQDEQESQEISEREALDEGLRIIDAPREA